MSNIKLGGKRIIRKKNIEVPQIGDKVEIAIKPYKGQTEIGIVKKVLTKKRYHSRGHKVMLVSNRVGRIIKIIKPNKKSVKKSKNQKCKNCKNCGKKY